MIHMGLKNQSKFSVFQPRPKKTGGFFYTDKL